MPSGQAPQPPDDSTVDEPERVARAREIVSGAFSPGNPFDGPPTVDPAAVEAAIRQLRELYEQATDEAEREGISAYGENLAMLKSALERSGGRDG